MSFSQEWFERAKKHIPGGVSSPVRSFKHVGIPPIYFDHAEGAHLIDVDGKRYIDFCLAFGPHLLGHGPAVVREAIHAQVDRATTFGACHPGEVVLAELVLKAYPFLDRVRWVNSGTEAVMTAARLARGFTGRPKIVQFEGCYHGHSDGFLAKSGSGLAFLSEASSLGVPPTVVQETLVARMDQVDALETLFQNHAESIAAVILEPVPANNGLWVPPRDHIERIVEIARHHGALVIFDEVICGFRLGVSGAAGFYDVRPDLVTLGKIIGGGLPVAAVVGRGEIVDALAPVGGVYQAGTLSGNSLGMAAGAAVLNAIYSDLPHAALAEATENFCRGLEELGLHVRRVASMFWIAFDEPGTAFPPEISAGAREKYAAFFRRALENGIYLPPSPYEVGFLSTAHTPEVLDTALEALAKCVD